MSGNTITKQHVLDAVDKIETEGIEMEPSIGYDVIIKGKAYPPKEVMRYANLIANGTMDWPNKGGEQTNNYLDDLGFEIVAKSEETETLATKGGFLKILRNIGPTVAMQFFGVAADLIDKLNVQIVDARLTYGTRGYRRLSITIGQRYCIAYVLNEENAWQFISEVKIPSSDTVIETKFDGEPLAYYYRCRSVDVIITNFDCLVNAAQKELIRTSVSGYRRYNNSIFEKVVLDTSYRKQLFNEAFPQNMTNEIDLHINTILYGPPGTGKTHKLNKYKETYFIDYGVAQSIDEVLKEKVGSYAFWKVLGAVLDTSPEPLTVREISDHPVVKARIKPTNKTKIDSLVWTDLLSHADDESTQLDGKYKRSIKLFHKDRDSRWKIVDDKKENLADIIGQELLHIAANPLEKSADSTIDKIRYNFITFHQKYSYEDFIEGIKPMLNNEDAEERSGQLQFVLKKGIFYNSCLEALRLVGYDSFEACYLDSRENRRSKFESAKTNPLLQFALFIDEINRANISSVFGELITLLEEDKRIGAENEMWLKLPYSNEKFSVPGNLFVIGTMNTADRSIALLDIALRRRFEFQALYPIYIETEWWAALLESLNQAIFNWKKNPDFFIGHAFFINKPETDRTKILNNKIIPLLYEYCQNNTVTVISILRQAGVTLKSTGIKENFQIIAE